MDHALIAGKHRVSRVGIGGHYTKMEEGRYEERYAELNPEEISARTSLIERAFEAGITYYDTTWRNEVDMLAESIRPLGIRDQLFINGMVLGTFTGSAATGISPSDYLNRWMDERLRVIPGGRFDSFMINAIDEGYDEAACGQVLGTLEQRRQAGDLDVFGFSCHDHVLARRIADAFPEFALIMLAYNYKNRRFEQAFGTYPGQASFVAMKPLIWYEYGVPFNRIDLLPNADELLGGFHADDIATKAVQWVNSHEQITTCVCAINTSEELDQLIDAGNGPLTARGEEELAAYMRALEQDDHIPFLVAAAMCGPENRRSLQFGLANLAKALHYPYPAIPLNAPDTDARLLAYQQEILLEALKRGLTA
ncbi:MAG: hypothetical protein MUF84_17760 [Anaerolineae bacterium]|nr:hypothetical protein [Anaerolineae bacterium]